MVFLIKRGGGIGPVKPGNQYNVYGANSYNASWEMRVNFRLIRLSLFLDDFLFLFCGIPAVI